MTTVNIGNEVVRGEDIAEKIRADIAFLTHRLALLREHRSPNHVTIETYQGMLESREAVLAWLLQGNRKASNG